MTEIASLAAATGFVVCNFAYVLFMMWKHENLFDAVVLFHRRSFEQLHFLRSQTLIF